MIAKSGLFRPWHVSIYRLVSRIGRKATSLYRNSSARRIDSESPTFLYSEHEVNDAITRSYLSDWPAGTTGINTECELLFAIRSLEHRFDLLGSGPVCVRYGMKCNGLEGIGYEATADVTPDKEGRWLKGRINASNLPYSQQVWRLVETSYEPIDWQLDFKSGYRWSENTWYKDIRFGHKEGIDIKVPWELARMQHLLHLALAPSAMIQSQNSEPDVNRYAKEFRNQILDFIATNPPRYGVNWVCTMDVAIRAANWLLAYDLFLSRQVKFDRAFRSVFTQSIKEHGRHIVDHLEWLDELHANHYLANIAGLAFIASYLERTPETDVWLALSVQELIAEVAHQFGNDGANFEASVCYHRLSAEMVLFATALLSNLPENKLNALAACDPKKLRARRPLNSSPIPLYPTPGGARQTPFPPWYWEKVEKMAEFTMHLSKPDWSVAQIGDNDSGRFFKVGSMRVVTTNDSCHPDGASEATTSNLEEIDLDHRHLVSGINAFFERRDFLEFAPPDRSAWLASKLSGGLKVMSYRGANEKSSAQNIRIGTNELWLNLVDRCLGQPKGSQSAIIFAAGGDDLRAGLDMYGYPDFGAYVFRGPRLFLAVRCGSIGQSGIGGHAHLDQLAIELVIDGRTLIADPGTYLYTPLPERRNAYRSARAHFVPRIRGQEPGDVTGNLFRLDSGTEGECLYFGPRGFAGRHFGYGAAVYRLVAIEADRIVVQDFAESGAVLEDPTPEPLPFSPGYGRQCRPVLD